MTILADASALVAIVTKEADAPRLLGALQGHNDRLCCAVGKWEAVLAIARKRTVTLDEARRALDDMLNRLSIRSVAVGDAEYRLALDAHGVYGKRSGHPARLNMGDCFAYACAKANDARLLYTGNDFSKTDLA
ncbi:type II toxin-antitoxin system VapC family toxin [Sphingomonas sp.]|uniref:type II toxin-antitoxin system VapC family toxin n=1 Tax=Sphingomonas sp. TaxID=28214 RepID=UPI001DAC3BD5|nr:type II toxin-antitoxin system VapC family toxin [Sphingomonas sp.]MBX9796687.1 type II toxin-antitoxin system VapC family toxin [Sphingomonas sp.]